MRGIGCILLFFSFFIEGYPQQRDSLLIRLPETTGIERVELLNAITKDMWLNYPEKAYNYAQEALQIAQELEDPYLISRSLRLIGGVLYYQGNYDSAIIYNVNSLTLAQELDDHELIHNSLNNLGLLYFSLGSYQNALEYLLRSLAIKNSSGIVLEKGNTLNNIGMVYLKLKDYKKARQHFFEALAIGKKYNDKNIILYSQNNIAQAFLDEGKIEDAESYYEKSLNLEVDNTNWKATAYSGMGKIEHAKNNFILSNQYFRKALELRQSIGDKHGISEVYYFFSKAESERDNLVNALLFLGRSQDIALEINRRDRVMENYELYSEIYVLKDQLDSAFFYQSMFLNMKDSLFNENLARNLSSIHLRIQEDEAQKIINKKDQQLEANRQLTIALIFVVLLSVALTLMIHYSYKMNRKVNGILAGRNDEITEQKREIEAQKEELLNNNKSLEQAQSLIKEQNKKLAFLNMKLKTKVDQRTQELESANKSLRMANLELDNFIYKSSHDIRGPLATLMGICNVALIDVNDEDALSYFRMLQKTAYNLNEILNRLKTISDINNHAPNLKPIHFERLINSCIEQNNGMEGANNFFIKKTIYTDLDYQSDPVLLDIIFYNLIQNAIRFQDPGQVDKFIHIIVQPENDNLNIEFMDNGIGIKQSDANNIFEMFSKAATQHQTIGLGLYIVKQSVQKLGGDIILLDESEMTHFKITLPLYNEQEIPLEIS